MEVASRRLARKELEKLQRSYAVELIELGKMVEKETQKTVLAMVREGKTVDEIVAQLER